MGAKQTPDWRPFVYGGIASVTAECGTFAIDTTKTRLQIQGQKINSRHVELKYKGMLHALIRISKEEGIRALYSGLAPAVLRQATYGTIKIGVYYTAKKYLTKNPTEENMVNNVLCGMLAGAVSSSLANPTDVLKVRMQATQKMNHSQKSMITSFVEIYKQEGTRGLWRGVGPTAQRAALIVGVELPVYDAMKRYLIDTEILSDGVANHFVPISSLVSAAIIAGARNSPAQTLTGFTGAVASNPIDVVRTRLMNQRNFKSAIVDGVKVQHEAIYSGSIDCLLQTVKTEGILALYKGFVPTWVRLGPWNIIFFITFEQLKKLY